MAIWKVNKQKKGKKREAEEQGKERKVRKNATLTEKCVSNQQITTKSEKERAAQFKSSKTILELNRKETPQVFKTNSPG